jgi:hypothetical protein
MDQRYQHQTTAFDLLQKRDSFALIMEQGTGKSRPVIEDWLARVHQCRVHDLVVIGPKGAYMNWIGTQDEPGEIDKWVPTELRDKICVAPWISGGNGSQRQALADLLHARLPRFLAMNVEALNREGAAREYLFKFIADRKVIGCIDESTTIAHESASRTKFILRELAHRFSARRILSGLVAPESPLNLYTQYNFLDWRILNQRSYWGFKNRYSIIQKVNFTPAHLRRQGIKYKDVETIVAHRNLDELHKLMMSASYRVTKDEVLDLPPKNYQFWDVELTEEQDRNYRQMRDVAMTQLANGEFSTASMKLDQLSKMHHILCGHVRQEDGTIVDIPEKRTDAVVEILQSHSGKAIIWAPYPRVLRKIVAKLRQEFGEDSTVGFWGETSQDDRLEARERIQNDNTCRFIVSNQSVGKFGNTWTACHMVIYVANSFDNEDRQQSEDRAHRIGQTKCVTYIDLRSRGTLDERLIQVLRKKITISSTLQGDEFKKWIV